MAAPSTSRRGDRITGFCAAVQSPKLAYRVNSHLGLFWSEADGDRVIATQLTAAGAAADTVHCSARDVPFRAGHSLANLSPGPPGRGSLFAINTGPATQHQRRSTAPSKSTRCRDGLAPLRIVLVR